MANTLSVKKTMRSSLKKTAVNQAYKDKFKKARVALEKAVGENKPKKELDTLLQSYYKAVDKASKRTVNVFSPNRAARLKSKMTKKLASL